eukprot:GHVU01060011.1.p1 GENE.GHVU01060011.1~~GHVU01060011.1.p1  ORF type:complete len:506 (+),score=27.62 GHVU01060011.1:214-1518(+)
MATVGLLCVVHHSDIRVPANALNGDCISAVAPLDESSSKMHSTRKRPRENAQYVEVEREHCRLENFRATIYEEQDCDELARLLEEEEASNARRVREEQSARAERLRVAQEVVDAARLALEEARKREAILFQEQETRLINEARELRMREAEVEEVTKEKLRNSAANTAAVVGRERLCPACFEHASVTDGVVCTRGHFICDACFRSHVSAECEKDSATLTEHESKGGLVACIMSRGKDATCDAKPFSLRTIALHGGDEGLEAYMKAKHRLVEKQCAADARAPYMQELKRLEQMSEKSRRVRFAHLHIKEMICNLSCPRCHVVFVDFDGCLALTCSNCKCGFCAYCLKDCGTDAHSHIGTCKYHRSRDPHYTSEANLKNAQKLARIDRVREYLYNQVGSDIHQEVLSGVERELNDLGIRIRDVDVSSSSSSHRRSRR